MKTEVTLKLSNLMLLALLLLFIPVSFGAERGTAPVNDIDIEWAAELSREIPWFEASTGKIVRDRIVRRFSLFCGASSCYLTVVSFPARNCMEQNELMKQPRQLLETTQAGFDVNFFEMSEKGSGDLSVVQRGKNSILIEFTSHEFHRSKNSILVSYHNRFIVGSSKVPDKVSGVESGVGKDNSLYVGGDEVVKFEYRQLPASTVCLMDIQSRDLIPR